jgi:hypothetical protein
MNTIFFFFFLKKFFLKKRLQRGEFVSTHEASFCGNRHRQKQLDRQKRILISDEAIENQHE